MKKSFLVLLLSLAPLTSWAAETRDFVCELSGQNSLVFSVVTDTNACRSVPCDGSVKIQDQQENALVNMPARFTMQIEEDDFVSGLHADLGKSGRLNLKLFPHQESVLDNQSNLTSLPPGTTTLPCHEQFRPGMPGVSGGN